MNLDLNGQPKTDNRTMAIALAVLAAALLIFAAFSRGWVARPELGFGPLGCRGCSMAGDGGTMSNGAFVAMLREMEPSEADKITSSAFAPMGYATFALCLLSALSLLATAGLAYKKQRRDLPVSPASIALLGLMTSLITACVFVATKPGGPGLVGISIGFWAYGAASVVGILAAQMLNKLIKPVDQDLIDAMNGTYVA